MKKWKTEGKVYKINKLIDIVALLMVIGFVGSTFIYWGMAPDIVPTHYNGSGIADGYGSKNTMFIMLPIVVILYLGLDKLSDYPQIYNYIIEITPKNKEKQYNMAVTFMKILKLEVVLMFLYVQIKIATSMVRNEEHMTMVFLFISMAILFGSIGFYIYKSIKWK